MPSQDDIRRMMLEASRKAALQREQEIRVPTGEVPFGRDSVRERRADAPDARERLVGEPLALGTDDEGHPAWFLEGRALRVGDVVEMYTNAANGWVRGRFEWAGGDAAPRLAMNVWDPTGPRDEDGLPPWIADVEVAVPKRAICRWPDRGGVRRRVDGSAGTGSGTGTGSSRSR